MPRTAKMFKRMQTVSEFLSLSVMILMVVAVVAGQASATAEESSAEAAVEFHQTTEDRFSVDFVGHPGVRAVIITIGVVSDLGQFRGENE